MKLPASWVHGIWNKAPSDYWNNLNLMPTDNGRRVYRQTSGKRKAPAHQIPDLPSTHRKGRKFSPIYKLVMREYSIDCHGSTVPTNVFTVIDPQTEQPYYGLRTLRERDGRNWIVTVVEPETGGDFIHSVLEEFLFDMAWLIPLVACATLAIGAISLHRGLRPLRRVSEQAATIEPANLEPRLATADIPAEIRPLVQAFNKVLDRLQAGMEQQRRFTANAAHQLRTPLTILMAELELLEGDEKISSLRRDAARMTRLVEQLLQVARLDSMELDVSQRLDLHAVAVQVISELAPLAQQKPCELALEGESVMVRGNFEALADALRNLIDNALTHTPANGSVVVEVISPGTIKVTDQGPGIPPDQKERVFERFWRGQNSRHSGAGLGLSIVREIMLAHGGEVIIEKTGKAGTTFVLKLQSR